MVRTDEEADGVAFATFAREESRRRLEVAGVFCLIAFGLGWTVGRIVLAGHELEGPGRFYLAVLVVVSIFAWLGFRVVVPRWKVNPMALGLLTLVAMSLVASLHVGEMGDLGSPFFYAIYALPPLSIGLPLSLRWRIVYTLAGPLTWAGTYFGVHPSYLSHPMIHVPVVCSFGIITTSIFLGHLVYGVARERFMLSRRLERQQAELEHHAEFLQREVEERSEAVARLSQTLASTSVDRQDLARALHDDLGQLIVAVRMELDLLERTVSRMSDDDGLGHMGSVVETLDRSVRTFIERLRSPATVDDLATEIDALVLPLRRTLDVETAVHVDAPLTDDEKELVHRFLQEAITNVVKHAEAGAVNIAVRCNQDHLAAEVRDDGRGFEPGEASGWGLRGMRERASAAGGSIDVSSGPEGTAIRLRVPVAHRASA